ncbi:MAG: MFS transporter [Bryobacteraceae bacterium]
MEKRAFRCLWLAQSISLLGDSLANYAVQATVVFRMHGTARDASVVLIAGLLPRVILGPVAGIAADHCGARRTMMAADLIRALLLTALVFAQGLVQYCAISFAIGSASAFFTPALAATIPNLVTAENLLRANARLQQSAHFARMASPVIAGALVTAGFEWTCYTADSLSFVASAALVGISVKHTPHITAPSRTPAKREPFANGVRAAIRNAQTRTAVFSMTIAVFSTGCFTALLPVFVRDSLRLGASAYGTLGTLLSAGTLAGSLFLSRYARKGHTEMWLHVGLSVVGVAILALAAMPVPFVAYPAFLLIGASAAAAMTASATLLQAAAPVEMRGRVAAVAASFTSLAQLAAIIGAAGIAAWVRVPAVYAFSGLLLLLPLVFRYFRQ